MERWPNLLLVGAAKAGTTSLHSYLGQHPAIFMSRVKEPHYFSRIVLSPERAVYVAPRIWDDAGYLALFADARDEAYVGESSPSYLYDAAAAVAIQAARPDARILIVLRDPVERAFSHYLNDFRSGLDKRSFRSAMADELARPERRIGRESMYLLVGQYAPQVERYQRLFPGRTHVLVFEEFFRDVNVQLGGLFVALGLDPSPAADLRIEALNVHRAPRHSLAQKTLRSTTLRRAVRALVPQPLRSAARESLMHSAAKPEMDRDVRASLRDYYAEDQRRLSDLLGRSLPWPTT